MYCCDQCGSEIKLIKLMKLKKNGYVFGRGQQQLFRKSEKLACAHLS